MTGNLYGFCLFHQKCLIIFESKTISGFLILTTAFTLINFCNNFLPVKDAIYRIVIAYFFKELLCGEVVLDTGHLTGFYKFKSIYVIR